MGDFNTRIERKREERKLIGEKRKARGLAILGIAAEVGTLILVLHSLFF